MVPGVATPGAWVWPPSRLSDPPLTGQEAKIIASLGFEQEIYFRPREKDFLACPWGQRYCHELV